VYVEAMLAIDYFTSTKLMSEHSDRQIFRETISGTEALSLTMQWR
jgi:hypothetical protein